MKGGGVQGFEVNWRNHSYKVNSGTGLEVLAMLMDHGASIGGAKTIHSVLMEEGGGRKKFRTHNFPIV